MNPAFGKGRGRAKTQGWASYPQALYPPSYQPALPSAQYSQFPTTQALYLPVSPQPPSPCPYANKIIRLTFSVILLLIQAPINSNQDFRDQREEKKKKQRTLLKKEIEKLKKDKEINFYIQNYTPSF